MTTVSSKMWKKTAKAVCPECSAIVRLSVSGLTYRHGRGGAGPARCAGGGRPVHGPGIDGRATAVFSLQRCRVSGVVLTAQMGPRVERPELMVATIDPDQDGGQVTALRPEEVRRLAEWIDAATQWMRGPLVPVLAEALTGGFRSAELSIVWSQVVSAPQVEIGSLERGQVVGRVTDWDEPGIAFVTAVTRAGQPLGTPAFLGLDQARDLRDDLRRWLDWVELVEGTGAGFTETGELR